MREEKEKVNLPDRFLMRPTRMEDAEAVTALLNACSVEQTGQPQWELHELRNDWQSPLFDLEADARVVISSGGRVVGYAAVWDQSPHVRIHSIGRAAPDRRGMGVGTALLKWIEDRARQSIARAPAEAQVALTQSAVSTDKVSQDLLRKNDYRMVRSFYRMVIDLDSPPPEPEMPEGITIRPMVSGEEERAVVQATRDAFRDHWGYVESPFEEEFREWMHWTENDPDYDPSLWFVATENGEIAGLSLCHPKRVEDPDLGWVNVLGVLRPWRRRGLALTLLHHSFGELYRRGKRKVGLGVDAESLTGATRLYEKAGMHQERRYNNYEKELRPGRDLRTRSVQD